MSLSAALNTANSGLNASARGALVVADNVANATTPGYAPRSLTLGSVSLGGTGTGVKVIGVERHIDRGLLGAQRAAQGADEAATLRGDFWRDIEQLVGVSDDPGALSQRLDRLGSALHEATSRPDSDARLETVIASAREVATKLNSIEEGLQSRRLDADRTIARDVETLNEGLRRVVDLNREITRQSLRGIAPNGLIDERQRVIDTLTKIMPMQEIAADHGAVRLMGPGGRVLTGSEPAQFSFTPVGTVTAEGNLANGAVSGLTLDGRPLDTSPDGPLAGGRLAAAFDVRDRAAPAVQADLDRLAGELITRFGGPQADPTLAPGEQGLFIQPAPTGGSVGLAGKLRINPLPDPRQGGELWRLRSGLGAAAPGPVGETAVLAAMATAQDAPVAPGPGQAARSLSGNAATFLSMIGTKRQTAENEQSFSTARRSELETRIAADGVDTDNELQRLLQIEQSYAANARVIRAVDDMLRRLTEI